ncbi:DUF3489 domain-containing protein [Phenylobacterium sp.]|uniref:DUF3489 domain-containing protein n=1 Tax=Phenylobacterium sp. TaxID=1871053 RepID=UPI0025F701F3|nr:DUF3489 domain-containing protein [Phenylobacterium sp.]MBX3483095.1 DUF3489 domain-containing protein [Phenylobacterium sp.]MCW5758441.1 DUF3489 domain-containing protein [Phenylobacterium sp.]
MSKFKDKTEQPAAETPARTTKINTVIDLLRRDGGADVSVISEITGWQAHSVRSAIAGHIKKKLGLTVVTEKVDGRTVYRIEA